MVEVIFLSIAAIAGTFKAVAITIGIVGAFRSLIMQRTVTLSYSHTRSEIPFRPWVPKP